MAVYDKYGRGRGYGQMAPGRDVSPYEQPKPNGRPPQADVNSAITGGMPVGGMTPFHGARQTTGVGQEESSASNPMGSSFPYTPPAAGKDLSNGAMENHATQLGMLSGTAHGAATGAQIGSVVPVLGTLAGAGIGAAYGAISGYLKGRTNNTKNDREDFAHQMGVPDSTALWQQLDANLPPDQAQELKDRALNRIGKHDMSANAQWMQDVQSALGNAPSKQGIQSAITGGAANPMGPAAFVGNGTASGQNMSVGYQPSPSAAGNAPAMGGAVTGVADMTAKMGMKPQSAAEQQGPATGAAPGTFQTKLMEGDPAKLGNAEHMAKSPKYDFLTLAQSGKYNYDQMPQMLDELKQGPNGRLWQGWTADDKGNMSFTGDPSQLAPEWNGATRVDAVGAFGDFKNGKGAAGWRWGVEGPGGPAQGAPGVIQNAITGQAPTVGGSDFVARQRQQIMDALRSNADLAPLAKKYGI